jgi:hypothetical protein
MSHHIDLDTLILTKGIHETRSDGVCLLEAAAWQAGEDHTENPAYVSHVLRAFGRTLNDVLPDGKRQELRPLIPLLPGTRGDGNDVARGYMALDWLVRTCLPAFLGAVGLHTTEAAVRDLRAITDPATARAAQPLAQQAAQKAGVAYAGHSAWHPAWHAGAYAARDAAWVGLGAAADTTTYAACDATRDAAGAAAGNDLTATVATLQDSAILLYRTMINPSGGGQP